MVSQLQLHYCLEGEDLALVTKLTSNCGLHLVFWTQVWKRVPCTFANVKIFCEIHYNCNNHRGKSHLKFQVPTAKFWILCPESVDVSSSAVLQRRKDMPSTSNQIFSCRLKVHPAPTSLLHRALSCLVLSGHGHAKDFSFGVYLLFGFSYIFTTRNRTEAMAEWKHQGNVNRITKISPQTFPRF